MKAYVLNLLAWAGLDRSAMTRVGSHPYPLASHSTCGTMVLGPNKHPLPITMEVCEVFVNSCLEKSHTFDDT